MNPEPVTYLLNGLIRLGGLPPLLPGVLGLVAFGALGETRFDPRFWLVAG